MFYLFVSHSPSSTSSPCISCRHIKRKWNMQTFLLSIIVKRQTTSDWVRETVLEKRFERKSEKHFSLFKTFCFWPTLALCCIVLLYTPLYFSAMIWLKRNVLADEFQAKGIAAQCHWHSCFIVLWKKCIPIKRYLLVLLKIDFPVYTECVLSGLLTCSS